MKFTYAQGATPYLDADAVNLIPKHIMLQSELNEWEQANILEAESWLFARRREKILTSEFIQKVHYKMFEKTWKWAGKFRKYQTNIGCQFFEISPKLQQLLSDIDYYASHNTYDIIETAIRLHHGLVYIHCFPNGNGRHSRMIADYFLVNNGQERLSWGRGSLAYSGELRKRYIQALKQADNHDFNELIKFANT